MITGLRALGHDVSWVYTDCPGGDDEALLHRAGRDRRVLLTFDKDFGELAYRSRLPAACGIILVRVDPVDDPGAIGAVVRVIGGRTDWGGHFSVIESDRLRMRHLG